MPPLIKGYLRINATFGRGVFVDKPFNSYDVFVMLRTKDMDSVYRKHFFGTDEKFEGEDFELPTNFIQTLGKIITSPAKGAMRVVRSVYEFLLREDAADADRAGYHTGRTQHHQDSDCRDRRQPGSDP